MTDDEFRLAFLQMMKNPDNPFHPLVWIHGSPEIGPGTYIGGLSEINAKGGKVIIGSNCDIASFVAINVADSHKRCIGLEDSIQRRDVTIGDHVFIGSHSVVLGGSRIGHHSVVAAGTVVRDCDVPPFSLLIGNPMIIKPGYYSDEYKRKTGHTA
jgi:acetyltransferase-like isoleucine patch superfamily enzyme